MNWERVLINTGTVTGLFALMIFWVGISLWMRVDADKRGITGWVWAFIGIITGPIGLVAYIFYRGNRPPLPVVTTRDDLIEQNSREKRAIDYDASSPGVIAPAAPQLTPEVTQAQAQASLNAALDAESRAYNRPADK